LEAFDVGWNASRASIVAVQRLFFILLIVCDVSKSFFIGFDI